MGPRDVLSTIICLLLTAKVDSKDGEKSLSFTNDSELNHPNVQ